jgi:hypothetical protein
MEASRKTGKKIWVKVLVLRLSALLNVLAALIVVDAFLTPKTKELAEPRRTQTDSTQF